MNPVCKHCGAKVLHSKAHMNRAEREGRPLFCNKKCFGLSRRLGKATAQKKEEKRLYDAEYRKKNLAMLKAKKAARFQQTYDPAAAAVKRKERMPYHVEYCRRPEYKQYKRGYDEQHRAKKVYGEFFEAFLFLQQIEKEVSSRASKQEIAVTNNTLNKSQTRRREYEKLNCNKS